MGCFWVFGVNYSFEISQVFVLAVVMFLLHRFPKPKVAGSNPAGRSFNVVVQELDLKGMPAAVIFELMTNRSCGCTV